MFKPGKHLDEIVKKMLKGKAEKTDWTPVIREQLSLSCEITPEVYKKSKKVPKDYEEYESLVFKHFDSGIDQTVQALPFSPEMKDELKQTAENVKNDLRKGKRLDIKKMIKDSFEKLKDTSNKE